MAAKARAKSLRWEKASAGRACGKERAQGNEFGEVAKV